MARMVRIANRTSWNLMNRGQHNSLTPFHQWSARRVVRVRREAHIRDHRRRVAAPGLLECAQHAGDTGAGQHAVVERDSVSGRPVSDTLM